MNRATIVCAAALMLAACSGNSASNAAVNAAATEPATAAASSEPMAEATAQPSPTAAIPAQAGVPAAAAPRFTDLTTYPGGDEIAQLAMLQVFDTVPGTLFEPNKPILRREFVRWLYNANNAIVTDDSKKIRPAGPGATAYFKDLPSSDKDFGPIEGMQDSGISVGFPDKTFRPDVPITREQALAVALGVDCSYNGNWSSTPSQAYAYLPHWKDSAQVSKTYAPIIASCELSNGVSGELAGRAFGKIALFRPQAAMTRGEAALMMYQIGSRTAASALPSATPAAAPPAPAST